MAKGEIACFVQFLFCHYVFKKPSAAEASESVNMRERVNHSQTGEQTQTGNTVVLADVMT